MAYTSVANSWEDLRKQARILENEIDMKLITFSKLGMGETGSSYKSLSEVNIPQPKGHGFETVAAEVQQLLEKLAELNHNMEEMASSEVHSSSAVLHTLQRHREILQDYKQEFHKMQANYQARREREDLLKSVRKDIDNYKNSAGLNRRLDIYLKENEHIRSFPQLLKNGPRLLMILDVCFRNTLGSLDGKHIAIRKPAKSGSVYYNYKGLLTVVNARKEFILADKMNECISDGGVMYYSKCGKLFQQKGLNLPQ